MAIRPTTLSSTDIFIQQMYERRASLEELRQEISSGVKINYASQNTGKAGTIGSLQATVARVDRHKERITFATGLLEYQETTLTSADSLLVRAKEIGTQAANGTISYADRALLAKEVFQLRDQMVSLANTTFQGRYLYGAADDDDAPFDAQTYTQAPTNTSDPAYPRYVFDAEAGTTTTRTINISDNDSIRVITPGNQVFSRAIAGLERLGRSLAGYRTTINSTTGLPDGTGTAYTLPADFAEQTHDILAANDAMDYARTNDFINERSDIGSRIARLEQVTSILDNVKTSAETSRASLQDTDIFEATASFSNVETSLQALLATGARINNLTLLNYL